MQSKTDEKDKEIVERVNELIRDPDANMNAASDLDESSSHAELMRLLNGVESQGRCGGGGGIKINNQLADML